MKTIRAIYEKGVFRPTEPVQLPEPCTVEFEPRLIADQGQGSLLLPPVVSDPAEKERLLRQVAENMRQNPIPAAASRLTRDELHARR